MSEDYDLLKTKDVAKRLDLSVSHFRKEIKLAPDFPKPVQRELASGGKTRPRWRKQDIENYLNKDSA